MHRTSILLRTTALVTASVLASAPAAVRADLADVSCPQQSGLSSFQGNGLNAATPVKSGVRYDESGGTKLRLDSATGLFKATGLGATDQTVFAAPSDFNQDGWTDFVGTGETDGFLRVYRNYTELSPEPDWDDVNQTRVSNFAVGSTLVNSVALARWRPIAAADFNGDGWPDVFRAEAVQYQRPTVAQIWLNTRANDAAGNATFAPPYDAMAVGSAPADLGFQNWGGVNVQVVDFNGDRRLDLLVGSATGSKSGSAQIKVFLNQCTLVNPLPNPLPPADQPLPCATPPKFATQAITLGPSNLGFPTTTGNLPVFAYADVDGDGFRDLVVGGPACCSLANRRLRLYKGLAAGNVDSASPQAITFGGAATAVFLADFSGDGKLDLIVGTDNFNYPSSPGPTGLGAMTTFWKNNGTATPFSDAATVLTDQNDPGKRLINPATMTLTADFDLGFVFDYDHDPANSPDLMIADGNHSGSFFVLANRAVAQFVPCGYVESDVVPLGALANTEMVVTAARIHPMTTLWGGTINFYMSNESPPNWVAAHDCGDGSGDQCAEFPKPIGRDVRWKAELCANPARTRTPELKKVDVSFDYTEASEHFRAGVVSHDGVAYLGGFRQPGYRGNLFAVNAGLTQTYWDAANSINAMADASRKIYTATTSGTTRLDFTTGNAGSASLQTTLGAPTQADAINLINWVRSARFGVGNPGIPKSRLGAIETSTPAILTRPGLPPWWIYASVLEKSRHSAFQAAQVGRPNLAIVGARDGMIHAIRTNPSAITNAPSGQEAWGFIPAKIASGIIADYTASLGGTTVVRSYPDGSPTLADYRRADGSYGTLALVSSGNGGQTVSALDVTNTVDPSTGNTLGPTPLWEAAPGGAAAGNGYSKPVVVRTRIAGAERFVVVAATGLAPDNPTAPWTKGRIVEAFDAPTGASLWKFQAECPVTSDLVAFETDDAAEPGSPQFDGYADRVVFADACGNVYKVDPARSLGGGWNDNSGLGSREVTSPLEGVHQYALFSTEATAGALGAQSPIAGAIATRPDATNRQVLFFGTGGLESFPSNSTNHFYAVYADTGEIRSKEVGTCQGGRCEKFYGGVVVTADQVIFTRTVDPANGSGTCDRGSAKVQAVDLNPPQAAGDDFTTTFVQNVTSAVMGSLYGDAGALYFANLSGEAMRIGTPRAPNAGGDSANPDGVPLVASTGGTGTTSALNLLGWRQVF